MKKTIFCITGLSGTGKSTICDILIKKRNLTPIVQYTSRPKRNGELDGVHYNFIKVEELSMYAAAGQVTCFEAYKVANGDIWTYGYMKDELYNGCIIPMNPTSVEILKHENEYNIISINLTTNEIIRLFRIFKRKDNQGIKEILRRTKKDKETFKNYKSNYQVRNKNINTTINEILHIININI
jgi:guanylate kinase